MSFDRFTYERECLANGYCFIAGIDEVGRGPLAGPVVASSAMFSSEVIKAGLPNSLKDVNDSKKLSEKKREHLFDVLNDFDGVDFGISIIESEEIDRINILQATHKAMSKSLISLEHNPDHLLVDGRPVKSLGKSQSAIVKGDSLSYSIGAASIIAKVTRDRMMKKFDLKFPGYGFSSNKGYGTREHLNALNDLGPCSIHRLTFAPIRKDPQDELNLFS
ncbi:MAG: ribonuclease HII [Verrucomicrobiales bacterium]|nr:ribonuclease HII [Verrucomicrobiales bacterium]|tara:strand:+ start:108 stop:764 length:657 start_codon:yes stop_codon:yes gene_type:complete